MIRSVVIIFSLLFTAFCYGDSDHMVKIMQVSKSGKTIFLNKGRADKIMSGDYGLLIQKNIIGKGKFAFKPVAKLKLLKLHDSRSIWVAYEVFIPKLMQANEKLMLFSESAMLNGRKRLKIKRTSLITNKNIGSEVRDFMLEGDTLAKKDEKYQVLSQAHKVERHYDTDVELVDVNTWENRLGDEKVFGNAIYKSPHAADFSKRKRVQSFEKMAVAFLSKFNDPGFDYNKFYKKQGRDQLGYLSSNSVRENYKELSDEEIEEQKRKDEELLTNLKAGGQGWSKVYTDEQLKRVLTKLSIAKEKQRRKGLISQKFDYQFFIGGGINLVNNENIEDADTTEQSKLDFEFSFEGYVLQKIAEFEKITFEISARRANDAFFGGDLNVKTTEFSVAGHMNWYPFYNPNVVDQHILYFGVLYRYGIASITNETTDEVGNYRLLTFPGFRISMKYNFENSFGYRVHAGFENINVDKIDANGTSGNLPERGNYIDGKLSLSLSKFF